MCKKFEAMYRRSLEDPEGFWAEAAQNIDWYKKWDRVFDDSNRPLYRWFQGGELNTCHNALDRHIDSGRAEQLALIYESPVTNTRRKFTYRELRDRVALFARALANQGVLQGDRVVLYMPMIPEAVISMLACARIGAVHSVVFGGFAANELATRIDDAKPRLIVSASCGIEPTRIVEYKTLLDNAINLSTHKPECCIILQRPEAEASMVKGRDIEWHASEKGVQPADCVPVAATDPLYILYTSGTTGQPKGVVRDNGGHAVAMRWSMENVYDVQPGAVYWAASDVGWVVGHSYIVYGPLMNGNTTILFEGKPIGTPDAGTFWRIVSEHGVEVLFTAPTAIRAIKREDPNGEFVKKYDMSRFRTLFLAGERCDPDTLHWAEKVLHVPVIDHWWQTETGWAIASNCMGIEPLPVKAGSPTRAVCGYDVQVLDEQGRQVPDGDIGSLVIKLPLPPGTLSTLWNADQRFKDSYLNCFDGYYLTGDAGYRDDDGYLWIMSRIDDVINVAGHRLSTGAIEEVLASHADIAECAVFGVEDDLKGELPLGMVVLITGAEYNEEDVCRQLVALVREKIGAVVAFKLVTVVKRLPKTRSGKILRGTMKAIADGKTWKTPATIDDATVLNEITQSLTKLGYPTATKP